MNGHVIEQDVFTSEELVVIRGALSEAQQSYRERARYSESIGNPAAAAAMLRRDAAVEALYAKLDRVVGAL